MFCRQCGRELKEGSQFCPDCGVAVKQSAPEQGPNQPAINDKLRDRSEQTMGTSNAGTVYLPASVVDRLPTIVKRQLAAMSSASQDEFLEEFKRKRKSVGLAYVL